MTEYALELLRKHEMRESEARKNSLANPVSALKKSIAAVNEKIERVQALLSTKKDEREDTAQKLLPVLVPDDKDASGKSADDVDPVTDDELIAFNYSYLTIGD